MSYLVLARKSRPQAFDQVIGQTAIIRTLKNSLARGRVAHAILFSGVRGVGKTTLARIMAKAINCQADDTSLRPCNQCLSCKEITSGTALDLYEIDGASNRGIQEIRELKEKIRFLPSSSAYKIIIIDEVHMLTTEAFNALLKTLEEPPAHIHFMFATTEIHKIPITILSRCQQYELKRIQANELYKHFLGLVGEEGFDIEQPALSLIVREAGGSVRDGLSLLDQMFSFGDKTITTQDVVEVLGLVDRDVLLQITAGLLEGQRLQVMKGLEEIFGFGMDIRRFIEDLMDCFRNLLFCKIDGCSSLIDLPDEDLVELQKLATKCTNESIHQVLSLLMSTAEQLKHSLQPRLTLETSFLKIIETDNVIAVTTLLGHVDKILASLPPSSQTVVSASPPEEPAKKKAHLTPPSIPLKPDKIEADDVQHKASETSKYQPETATSSVLPTVVERTPAAPEPQEPVKKEVEEGTKPIEAHSHKKDIRKNWQEFIQYVKERKLWMATDLQRADAMKQNVEGELHLIYDDPANCAVLRQKENRLLLTEYTLDFFQKPLKIHFILPEIDDSGENNNGESPHKIRQELANDPLVIMTAETFTGQVTDIRIGPRSR